MINVDAVGISAKTGHGFVVYGPRNLVNYMEEVSSKLGAFDRCWELPESRYSISPYSDRFHISSYSDHWPFYMLGVPTAHFLDIPADPIDLRFSHTTADTVDKVSPKGIKDAAQILALTLLQIANEDHIPIEHTPIEDVIENLEKNGIAEDLRVEKRWLREGPGSPLA
jgi:hypothetical protein